MPKHNTTFRAATRILTTVPSSHGKGATVSVGAAEQRDATVRMKKIHGGEGIHASAGEAGNAAAVATMQVLQATDHTHGQGRGASAPSVPLEIEKQAIVEVAAGASPRHVEGKYDLHKDYVRHALSRRFGSPEAAKLALQGLVLENALACMVQASLHVHEMSGPQAVMSGAILVDKSLALEKSIAERPKTIDFSALANMGKTLKVVREIISAKTEANKA